MNWKDVFEIEKQLLSVCEDYIEGGGAPKDEEMEACYKAYAAVWDYRNLLQEKEKVRRAATQTDKEITYHPQYKTQRGEKSRALDTNPCTETVTIRKNEYEELIRNSENLRDIQRVTQSREYDPDRNAILALCGYEVKEENYVIKD